MVYQTDLCRPRIPVSQSQTILWLQYDGRSDIFQFEITMWDLKREVLALEEKKVQKPRWLDAAAGSKLVTKKYGRLVYVCFIKHLFLVLFLAALAAGCQQGSWFWSSVQI